MKFRIFTAVAAIIWLVSAAINFDIAIISFHPSLYVCLAVANILVAYLTWKMGPPA